MIAQSSGIIRHVELHKETADAIVEAMNTSRVVPVAADRGLTGDGVGIYMAEIGCPNAGFTNDFTSLNPNLNAHSQSVVGIMRQIAPDAHIYCRAGPNLPTPVDLTLNPPIDVVNRSNGVPNSTTYLAVDRAWDNLVYNNDIPTFVIAGNEGLGSDEIRSPAKGFNIITVGAHDDNDVMAGFSSALNPNIQNQKPEISGPGVNVVAGGQASASGTSFSSPHAAAMLANYMQIYPWLRGAAALSKSFMMSGSKENVAGGANAVGVGGVDFFMTLDDHSEHQRISDPAGFNALDAADSDPSNGFIERTFYIREDYSDVRIVLSWLNSGNYTFNNQLNAFPLGLDLDIQVEDPSGNTVAISTNRFNSYELVSFDPTTTGDYIVKISQFSQNDPAVVFNAGLSVNYANLDGTPIVNPSDCIDTDGDGWGWNGVASCQIADPPVIGDCIDSDGDGWGWNGVASCQVVVTPVAGECIDSDGDGWGWNGVESCIP